MRAASSVVDVVSAVIDPIAGRGWGPGCWGRYGGRTLFATQPSHSEIRLPHWHRMPTCHPFARSSSSSKQAAAAAASGAPICMHIISIVSSAFPPPHPHAPALKSNNGAKQITRQQTILSTHTHALAHAQAPPPPPQSRSAHNFDTDRKSPRVFQTHRNSTHTIRCAAHILDIAVVVVDDAGARVVQL